jgi:allophanate hydrolase
LPSVQTQEFPQAALDRFTATSFFKSAKSNRMAALLDFEGDGFLTETGLSILSEVVVPGDIQITGDGHPAVLMPDCQTTGGYPRIATVLPCDFAIVAQATPGTKIGFRFVELKEALVAHRSWHDRLSSLPGRIEPLIRDPASMADLLSHQLIGGVISARES